MQKLFLLVSIWIIVFSLACITYAQTTPDDSGPATTCNGNVAYSTDTADRYSTWNGQCTVGTGRQADGSGGIGQGCCELACGADHQCDEQSAGQGSCTSTCKFIDTTTCTNQVASNYGNSMCRSNVNVNDCNWQNGTENVTVRETSSGMWEVKFNSSSAVDVNIFVVYGRIVGVSQNDWKPHAGYIKPEVCAPDSDESTCNPQLLGTHSYCIFRNGSAPSMLPLPNPSMITSSNPARGFWPLPLSSSYTATITVNTTDEARRRGIPVILYYQFNKALKGGSYYSWCSGSNCTINECGTYTGCFEYAISANEVLCVKTQNSAVNVISSCGHHAWESRFWDKLNLTSAPSSCLEEGQSGIVADSLDCCPGLTKISCDAPDANNTCPNNCTDSFFCTNCGDGICGLGENKCNCPGDCVAANVSSVNCSACDLGSTCNCSISGCNSGLWLLRNTTYPPAIETKSSNLPPASLFFTPTALGNLEVIVFCDNPNQTFRANVDVRKAMVSCPSCYVGRECECNVTSCNNGTLTVTQNTTVIKNITFPPAISSVKFTVSYSGVVTITAVCYDPSRGPNAVSVRPATTTSTSSSTTTIELQECPSGNECCNITGYKIKSCPAGQTCNKNKCEGGADYSGIILVIFIILILIAIPFLLYVYFIRRKSKEKFDQLYRRWTPRRYIPKRY